MSELSWIHLASKAFTFCAALLKEIITLQDKCDKLEQEATRLKTLVEKQETFIQDLTGKDGSYDTVY